MQRNLASQSLLLHINVFTSEGIKGLEYPSQKFVRLLLRMLFIAKWRSTSLSPPEWRWLCDSWLNTSQLLGARSAADLMPTSTIPFRTRGLEERSGSNGNITLTWLEQPTDLQSNLFFSMENMLLSKRATVIWGNTVKKHFGPGRL